MSQEQEKKTASRSKRLKPERCGAEERLRESEERFRSAFDYAAIGMALVAPKGRFLKVNPFLSRIVGYSEQELLATTFQRITHPDDLQHNLECVQRLLAGSVRFYELEKRYLHKDGHTVWARVNASLLHNRHGRPLHLITQIQDITARKHVEDALHQKNALVQLLQEVAVAANEATSIEDALQRTLDQVCAHTGWQIGHAYLPADDAPDTLLPVALWHHQDRKQLHAFRRAIERIPLTPGAGLPGRVFVTGQPAWVADVTTDPSFIRAKQTTAAGLRAALAFPVLVGKEVVAVMEFFAPDIVEPDEPFIKVMANIGTQLGRVVERKRAEQQLRESERSAAMGTTTAKLVHEIGNPLNGMYTTVQLLERDLAKRAWPQQDLLRSTVHDLSSEINRLRSLFIEFRSLARPHPLDLQPTPLARLITELLAVETSQYAAQGIQLANEIAPDLPPVMADQEKLKQVLLNLCQNAVEAMPHGGTLTVRATYADGLVRVDVADTGSGLPKGVDIFELFTTTKPNGMGLGLAVVRQIVLAHAGTITCTSEPGQGTVFRVSLPACAAAQKKRTRTHSTVGSRSNSRKS